MKPATSRPILALALLVVLAAAGGLVYLFAGGWDVAAVDPEPSLVDRALAAIAARSVARHAAGIVVPPLAGSEAGREAIRRGAVLYGRLCASCHGGPGVRPSAIGMGLNPGPPDLADAAGRRPPREVYWMVAHGVERTGMPGFAPTLGERDLWSLVALVEALPRLSPVAYRELEREERGDGSAPPVDRSRRPIR